MNRTPMEQSIQRWRDQQARRERREHWLVVVGSGVVMVALAWALWRAWGWLV